jgi:dsDNA-specific endonuclease/ATPase MutS2
VDALAGQQIQPGSVAGGAGRSHDGAVSDQTDDEEPFGQEPVELPLDGELDLHLFRPRDAGDVVEAYLEACREKGVLDVRIAHGKGTGALRRRVHAVLTRLGMVERFWTADERSGGWGATFVRLRPPD